MTEKINIVEPAYYSEFECIGSSCKNNCCHGWTITIDEKTYKKYKKIKHPNLVQSFRNGLRRMRNNPTDKAYGKFKLIDGRCPMLNEQGLCNIYIHIGSDYMCTTCKQFPRKYVKCGDSYTRSMSLACEEVARVLFANQDPLIFNEIEESLDLNTLSMNELHPESYFLELRSIYIAILQNRNYSIQERLIILGMLSEQLDEATKDDIPSILGVFLEATENMSLKQCIKEIELREDLQHASYKQIMMYNMEKRKTLGVYVGRAIAGLALDEEYEVAKPFIHAENKKFNVFLQDHSYMIEHYLVNLLVDGILYFVKNQMQIFYQLVIRYAYVKMFLAGYKEEEQTKELTEEIIVNIERSMGHSSIFIESVDTLLESNTLTLENAMYLIMS